MKTSVVIVILFLILPPLYSKDQVTGHEEIRSIILMIPDGLSIEGATLARWYNGGRPLAWDPHVCGLVRTHSADAPIADSAPASTAYATGHKSQSGFVAILPDVFSLPGAAPVPAGRQRAPLLTILQAARLAGKATGLVATSQVTHATPAAFSAHTPERGKMNDIALQLVYSRLDAVLGGGADFLNPDKRPDREDLWAVLEQTGSRVARTPAEMRAIDKGPLWGIFADRALTCELSRDPEKEPSLAEMTDKAIEILSRNEKGFFLLVEGSQIDWAAHGNDPAAFLADTLAFNQAVEKALDFAGRDGGTVVIVVSDHGTGGISMGAAASNDDYDKRSLDDFILPLQAAVISAYELEKELLDVDCPLETRRSLVERYGLRQITDREFQAAWDYLQEVRAGNRKKGSLDELIGPMLSRRSAVGWTTTGHTGGDVSLAVYHPRGERPSGVVDNTEVNHYMQRLFSLNLDTLSAEYYIEAESAFLELGARVTRVKVAENKNPELRVRKGYKTLLIPAHRNQVYLNGRRIETPTLNVYNGRNFFVSRLVLELLN